MKLLDQNDQDLFYLLEFVNLIQIKYQIPSIWKYVHNKKLQQK